jgi:hypothetical protein
MTITASVDLLVAGNAGTRYVCTGWTGTGSVPTSGSTNLVQFVITQNSSITWLWQTQYELTIEILPEGSGTVELSPAGEDGYYDDGEVVTLTANANSGYVFGNWSGDLTGTNNPETLTMDGPKNVTANFIVAVIYVHGTNGDDANDGSSWDTGKKTIQAGLDAAGNSGCSVLVANGTYTGTGNKNLDFNGKAIHLNSVGGAANCIIDCQNSGCGFYFHTGETNEAIVEGFTIQNGNIAVNGCGSGILCSDNSNPIIRNCTIRDNFANSHGGGIAVFGSGPIIADCAITNNSANGSGGGITCCWGSNSTVIRNCTITNNRAITYGGGGIGCSEDSSIIIINCRITNNIGNDGGGGIACWNVSPSAASITATNCTISGNTAARGGGIAVSQTSSITTNNSIIWGNSSGNSGDEIYTWDNGSTVTLNYSDYSNAIGDVEGFGTATPDANCINLDPLFVDAANGNYRLQATSPCIDAGNNSYIPVGVTTDLDGNPRIVDGNTPPDGTATVDMGAYEYQP